MLLLLLDISYFNYNTNCSHFQSVAVALFDTAMVVGAALLVTHGCSSASGPICSGAVAVALVDTAIVVGAALLAVLLVTRPVPLMAGATLSSVIEWSAVRNNLFGRRTYSRGAYDFGPQAWQS